MKCVSVKLGDRRSSVRRAKSAQGTHDAPRRICQILMADPSHEEDPRWKEGGLDRFYFDVMDSLEQSVASSETANLSKEIEETKYNELCLSVLNLDLPLVSKSSPNFAPRQCFKYKTYQKSCNNHRMFVKQTMPESELDYSICDTQSSVNMDCRINDFMDEMLSEDAGISSPTFSTIFAYNVEDTSNYHEDIAFPNDLKTDIVKEESKTDIDPRSTDNFINIAAETNNNNEIQYINNSISNYAVNYQKSGKRRSLTISRTQSPETVQIIRVDVMCSYSDDGSDTSENPKDNQLLEKSKVKSKNSKKNEDHNLKKQLEKNATSRKPHLYNKVVLATTTKRRDKYSDEDFSLLCKTFKFCDRYDRLSVKKSIYS